MSGELLSVCPVCAVCVIVRDLTRRGPDPTVERATIPPYQKGPLDATLPLLYGFLMGFIGPLVAGASIFLIRLSCR